MECYNCDLTSICKIYEFINSQRAIADISINKCRVKSRDYAAAAQDIQAGPTEPDLKIRSAESIASVSERIKQLSAPDPVKQETFSECPECKEGVAPADICECSACNKQVCIGCAIEDGPTRKTYCEECWDNL